jgi:DnaA-homolog protein
MSAIHPQIPFEFPLQKAFSLENFVVGANQAVVEQLQHQFDEDYEPLLYLWGTGAAGCSHLLQAACQSATTKGRTAIYLPMDEIKWLDPVMLQGIENVDLICLDHLQAVAGLVDWEEALFHLFNRVLQQRICLLVGASSPPRGVGIALADLQSRFMSCAIFQVMSLEDVDKVLLLQEQASEKGIELHQDAAQYILNRSQRSTDALLEILESLDRSSLSAGRKLTIPFIKQSMGW